MSTLEDLVSPHCGIVVRVDEQLLEPTGFPIAVAIARPARMTATLGVNWDINAGGAGWTPAEARRSAIGEAVERYSASFVDERRLTWASWRQLGPGAVHPDRLRFWSAEQLARPAFPYRALDEEDPTHWVEGHSLTTQRRAHLPAETVFLGYAPPKGHAALCPQTSTGLACAESFELAALKALLEVVERDAFTLTWSSCVSMPHIEPPPTLPDGTPIGTFRAVTALDLSPWHELPVVLVVIEGDDLGLALGCAAALAPEAALHKAFLEALQTGSWLRSIRESPANMERAAALTPSQVLTFDDHVTYWADPARTPQAAFLTANPSSRRLVDLPCLGGADPQEQLGILVARLADAGIEAFAVDVTSPDVAAAGFHVVRCVAPALCPLDVAHDEQLLGHPRRLTGAWRTGLAPAPLSLADLNPLPHPFP